MTTDQNDKQDKQDEQAVVTEMEDRAPSTPEQATAPAMRHLVIETDGNSLFVRSSTMGLLELRTALQMVARQVDSEINQKAASSSPAPDTKPPDGDPAEESNNE